MSLESASYTNEKLLVVGEDGEGMRVCVHEGMGVALSAETNVDNFCSFHVKDVLGATSPMVCL